MYRRRLSINPDRNLFVNEKPVNNFTSEISETSDYFRALVQENMKASVSNHKIIQGSMMIKDQSI